MFSLSTKSQILSLYRSLLREAKAFPAYNYRNYALRRIRHSFRQNKSITDEKIVALQLAEGDKNLEIIKRQVLIGKLYSTEGLVIERTSKV